MRCCSQLMIVQWLAGWQGVILQLPSHQIEFRFSIFGLCTLHSQKRLCYKENAINLNFHQKIYNGGPTETRHDTGRQFRMLSPFVVQSSPRKTYDFNFDFAKSQNINFDQTGFCFVGLNWVGLDWKSPLGKGQKKDHRTTQNLFTIIVIIENNPLCQKGRVIRPDTLMRSYHKQTKTYVLIFA